MVADQRHTILVVDDEADVVKSVQDLLRLDYRVLGTTRAADAVEILSREEVHVVMSDQRMPGMTGVEFLKRVRGEHPEAVRLLFTGYADIRAVIDAINQGSVYRYIAKPWDPDELQTIIREACERYDLLVARKQLTEQLQRKNAELEASNAELLQANALKRAFIQVASHELRTPLAILLGLTSLARQPGGMEGADDYLGRIQAAVQRLDHLVEQIVAMLQAGAFDHVLDRSPVMVAVLLAQAVDDVRPFAARRGQRLEMEIDGELGSGDYDAAKIRDSLDHLLLNAIKFTPDGGAIHIKAREADGGIEVQVVDEGIGIEPAVMARLFQPFFTGFDALHHSSGQFEFKRRGLGLGLCIAKAFVEMHGGRLSASSEVDRGSTFTLWLPQATAAIAG